MLYGIERRGTERVRIYDVWLKMESKIELKLAEIRDKGDVPIVRDDELIIMRGVDVYYKNPNGAIVVKITYVGKTDMDIEKKLRERKVYLVFENEEK